MCFPCLPVGSAFSSVYILPKAHQLQTRKPCTLVELAQWRQGWREAPPPRPPVRVGGVVRTGSAHTKRALWATGTTQQNGCCAASRLRGSIPASPHCLSRLAVPSRAETVSVLRRLDRAREAGGKGRKALAQREVGRLRTHWGGGVCLERGLDGKEEGRGRRGQERGGQGRRGVRGPGLGAAMSRSWGAAL